MEGRENRDSLRKGANFIPRPPLSHKPRCVLVVLFVLSWLLLACRDRSDHSGKPKLHKTLYPLVSYQSELPERVSWTKEPRARWIELAGSPEPAIVGWDDFDLSVTRENLDGTVIRGRFGWLDAPKKDHGTKTIFRVLVAPAADEPGLVLFEETVTAETSGVRPFRVGVPKDRVGMRIVSLQVEYETTERRPPTAVWVEPVIEVDRAAATELPPEPWNVVLITSDTTRADFLSCYGGTARTPRLEELTADGILFDSAFSVAFGTTPSHSSLLTSSPAAQHGVYNNKTILDTQFPTLAEVLQDHGYSTAAFVSARPLVRSLGLSQGFDLFDDILILDNSSGLGGLSRVERRADATVSRFTGWLDEYGTEPFFSWIHLFDPHQPYSPPGISRRRPQDPMAGAESLFYKENDEPNSVRAAGITRDDEAAGSTRNDEQLLAAVNLLAKERYRAEIEFVDGQIGKIVDDLKNRGIYDRTMIVFVADHGENFLERGPELAFHHGSMFSGVTQIPLIVKLPSSRQAGARHDFLLGNLDVAPTILDVLEVEEQPAEWVGRSFLPLLIDRSRRREFRQYLVLEGSHQHEIAVRTKKWLYRRLLEDPRRGKGRWESLRRKLGYEPGQSDEIYDREADPSEFRQIDIAACPDSARLRSIAENFLANKTRGTAESLTNSEHLEALKTLGYTE